MKMQSSSGCLWSVQMSVVIAVTVCLWALASGVTSITRTIGTLGRVRGFRDTIEDTDIDIFLGIPFAKPPVGTLRFQRPMSAEPWKGIRDATHRPRSCYQIVDRAFQQFEGVDMWNPNTNMSEDCLYLNIWTPVTKEQKSQALRPVMVWIYGGGFNAGTSTLDIYDGRTLAAVNDVVVVSMQYRIGTLGFLYLGNSEVPGNMGMVDQLAALQWVFNHIKTFGGDQHQITLFGESAGAASVSTHLISPLSQDLFKYAIMESSTALCPWAVESTANAKKRAFEIAKKVNCPSDGPLNELVACLKEVPAMNLTIEMWTSEDVEHLLTPMMMVVDGYFFREHPATSIREGRFKQTNILLGVNKDEGTYFLVYGVPSLFGIQPDGTMNEEEYRGAIRGMVHMDEKMVYEAINFEYDVAVDFTKKPKMRDILDDMMGDRDFICPVVEFAHTYADHNNSVYLYQFRHRTSQNPWPAWMGVMHGYEIDHVFGHPLNSSYSHYTSEEVELSRRMMSYWTNFARTGDPNKGKDGQSPEPTLWPTHSTEDKEYMILDTGEATTSRGLRNRQCQFWTKYIPELRKSLNNPNPGEGCGTCRHQMSLLMLVSLVLTSLIAQLSLRC